MTTVSSLAFELLKDSSSDFFKDILIVTKDKYQDNRQKTGIFSKRVEDNE